MPDKAVEPITDLTVGLKAAEGLIYQVGLHIREYPEHLATIDQFLELKRMADKLHSLTIELNGAIRVAHDKWLEKHPVVMTVSQGTETPTPPQLPTDPAERQALLNEIDSTP